MRRLLLLLLTISFYNVYSQDLNGIWKGKLTQEPGGCYPEYNIELQINFIPTANTLSGKAYDFYDQSRYVKLDFTGRFNATTKRMVIIEANLLESKVPLGCQPCIKTYDMTWSRNGSEEILTGECKGRKHGSYETCPAYKLTLKRAAKSDFAVDVEQSAELMKLQEGLKLQDREKEVVQSLKLDTSAIQIDLYDNAEIDNDTVTIFLNGKLLLYKKKLTDKPLTITLNAFPGTDYELMMYADNLGSIPPNTSLMVVRAGTKKYEVRLASSEKKTAAVRFRYDQPPAKQ